MFQILAPSCVYLASSPAISRVLRNWNKQNFGHLSLNPTPKSRLLPFLCSNFVQCILIVIWNLELKAKRYNTRIHTTMISDNGKKNQRNYLTWTDQMDDALLEVLVEHHSNGGNVQNVWKPQVYTAAIRNICKKCFVEITKDNILSRCKTFEKHYEIISKILSHSGFGWDRENNRLSIGSDAVWAKYVKNNKAASCYKTKVVKKWDSISLIYSKDHATGEAARAVAVNAQEMEAGAAEKGTEGSAPAGQETHRGAENPQENDTLVGIRGGINCSLQASMKSNEPVQVPQPASPGEILMVLKQIPDLARADLLRAYSMLIRDDRHFKSLVALEMDMRKDWLLMEIGEKHV